MAKVLLPQVDIYQPGVHTTRLIMSYINVKPREGIIERQRAVDLLSHMSYNPGNHKLGVDEYVLDLKNSRYTKLLN